MSYNIVICSEAQREKRRSEYHVTLLKEREEHCKLLKTKMVETLDEQDRLEDEILALMDKNLQEKK